MNKGQANNESFMGRSGSFSTHSSRKGLNLLGWGEEEILDEYEKRDSLVRAKQSVDDQLRVLNSELKATLPVKKYFEKELLRKELRQKSGELRDQITILPSRKTKYEEMSDFIIKVIKSRMTKPQWNLILKEANELYLAQFKEEDK